MTETGVSNDPNLYKTPLLNSWGIGRDRKVPRQDLKSVFFGFKVSDEEVANNEVKIPEEARVHFQTQGGLEPWSMDLDLGAEEENGEPLDGSEGEEGEE